MSLYYEAASILSQDQGGGSLKSLIYNDTSKFKSRPAQLYALITETAKYDGFLKEVIDNAGILKLEPKLTPLLSLLLVHDYLFSGSNIAASKDHPLKLAILRHKARLSSEFTKARIRRKCATVSQLKVLSAGSERRATVLQPRWVRVNSLRGNGREYFAGYSHHPVLYPFMTMTTEQDEYHVDKHIPDLVALPPGREMTKSAEYKNGQFILQDKASCFPAYLLLGEDDELVGDVIDACAAPGNKTTHLASILWSRQQNKHIQHSHHIFACERDPRRSEVLQKMVDIAGAEKLVSVMPKQDFFALHPNDERFAKVTHLLLDPTCSGSGIVGREDIPVLKLPEEPRDKRKKLPVVSADPQDSSMSKKRKRDEEIGPADPQLEDEQEEVHREVDIARLEKLSNLQTRIIEHAMTFPSARRISYSTCSTHPIENEKVVARVLSSEVARNRCWRALKQEEQVKGLREWKQRGVTSTGEADEPELSEDQRIACIRCYPGTEDGTMGFFVCAFVRDSEQSKIPDEAASDDDDEFNGFED